MTTPGTRAAPYAPFTTVAANADLDTWLPGQSRTVATIPAYLSNNAVLNVQDYGAVGDGVVDDTAAIQTVFDLATSLGGGLRVVFPEGVYKTTSTLVLPKINGMVIAGVGLRASIIRAATVGQSVFDTDNVWATFYNGLTIRDLNIDGNSVAAIGIKWSAAGRFSFLNCRVTHCTDVGVRYSDTLAGTIIGCEFDGNRDAIRCISGGNTGFNAVSILGCNFENSSRYGIDFGDGASGVAFHGNTVESCHGGGIVMGQTCVAMDIRGCYFEENTDHIAATADIALGVTSYVSNVTIEGNLFNGRTLGQTYDYTPLRLKYAQGVRAHHNLVQVGNRWVVFNSADGTVTNCSFVDNEFRASVFDSSNPSTMYASLPRDFVTNGNRIVEAAIPTLPGNLFDLDQPFSFTTISLAGTSAFAKSDVAYRGRKAVALLTCGNNSAQVSRSFTLSSTQYQEYRGKFVTVTVPVLGDADATAGGYTIAITSNGTGGGTVTNPFTALLALGWKSVSATLFVPTDATTLSVTLASANLGQGIYLAKAMLSVGVQRPIDSDYGSGFPAWEAAADPATGVGGTWSRGDLVRNSTPSSGGPPGWVCTAAGTPGTWKAMANLA